MANIANIERDTKLTEVDATSCEESKVMTLPSSVLFNKIPEEKKGASEAAGNIKDKLNYKDPEFLITFATEGGRIRSRRETGLTRKEQRELSKCIKRARQLGLMIYTATKAA